MKTLLLLLLSSIILSIGSAGGPLLLRLYFIHGGQRVWFSSWLQTAGFPIILLPLTITYIHRRRRTNQSPPPTSPQKHTFFTIKPRLFITCVLIGILAGLDSYLYAYGIARLPVSTSSLIIATQLAFTAGFAFVLVKQKFSWYSVSAVVLLTIGAGVLAVHSKSDRPANESNREYVVGFLMTLAAAALYGFILPLIEFGYRKAKQQITFSLVMETQVVILLVATGFCTVGMLLNNDFKEIPREAKEFELGEIKYYLIVVFSALVWQFNLLGIVGVIFTASSLLSGIILAVLLPVTEILAVIFYKEEFQVGKGVSLAISIVGFASYFYGETKESKKQAKTPITQQSQSKILETNMYASS